MLSLRYCPHLLLIPKRWACREKQTQSFKVVWFQPRREQRAQTRKIRLVTTNEHGLVPALPPSLTFVRTHLRAPFNALNFSSPSAKRPSAILRGVSSGRKSTATRARSSALNIFFSPPLLARRMAKRDLARACEGTATIRSSKQSILSSEQPLRALARFHKTSWSASAVRADMFCAL